MDNEALEETPQDDQITADLSKVMNVYQGGAEKKRRQRNLQKRPNKTFKDLIDELNEEGIPISNSIDYENLESTHNRSWDSGGSILEYYSPVLRSFIPVNMRGRYRGCWSEDSCVQGINIRNLPPKRDALEGFVDKNRHERIQKRYEEMFDVATDEAHLDYLVEMQRFIAEVLPIPIAYDVVNFGVEVMNENMNIVMEEEQHPPLHRIYRTTEEHAVNMRKKLSVYAALGLEPLHSNRPRVGQVDPRWLLTRDEIMKSLLESRIKNEDSKEALNELPSTSIVSQLKTETKDKSGKEKEDDGGGEGPKQTNFKSSKTKKKKS